MTRRFASRGQAAMEFLMTYGWAILIVIAGIAALNYFGMFDLREMMGDKIVVPSGFAPHEYKFDATGVYLSFTNSRGVPLRVLNVTINTTSASDVTCHNTTAYGAIGAQDNTQLRRMCAFSSPPADDAQLAAALTIRYIQEEESLSHTLTGGQMNLRRE